jgi:RNA polymerase sigma factor (TIGR02999 family)
MEDLAKALTSGDDAAVAAAVEALYPEMRRLAARLMVRERESQTLQPTALVHEALMRLLRPNDFKFSDQTHFYAVAAAVMRRILVDHARVKSAAKRSPAQLKEEISTAEILSDPDFTVLEVDEALTRLEKLDPRASRIVEMRFFAGLTDIEIAEVLGISDRTVKREWAAARAWLYNALNARV